MQINPWITAARLRTLPLAVSNILLGSMIACRQGTFHTDLFLLGMATAVLLQILSNFANDYGDFVNGADEKRVSKFERALQSGKISPRQMRRMLIVLSALTLATGILLIASAAAIIGAFAVALFVAIGVLCIIAAITYTVGKKPYGYTGLGDVSVFVFFGIAGVCGIYFLQTGHWDWKVLLPASSFGLLSMGVLNINNIRDRESDFQAGKRTLVVKIGSEKAKIYHACIIVSALAIALISTLIDFNNVCQLLYLLTVPFFILNIMRVFRSESSMLDNELRNLSLASFLFALTYGIGLIL